MSIHDLFDLVINYPITAPTAEQQTDFIVDAFMFFVHGIGILGVICMPWFALKAVKVLIGAWHKSKINRWVISAYAAVFPLLFGVAYVATLLGHH
jgi:hypothetical protein